MEIDQACEALRHALARRMEKLYATSPKFPLKGVDGVNSLKSTLFQRSHNIDSIFIAYAFSYIEGAIRALENAPSEVEAIIIQPYDKGHFVSAKDAMHLYRHVKDGEHIPILFTSRPRHQEQLFEYGSRLVDLRDRAEIGVIEKNIALGKWLMWDDSLYAQNFLIVQNPIKKLSIQPPVSVATNLISGLSQGDPVGAVSIPAPKVMGIVFKSLLENL